MTVDLSKIFLDVLVDSADLLTELSVGFPFMIYDFSWNSRHSSP